MARFHHFKITITDPAMKNSIWHKIMVFGDKNHLKTRNYGFWSILQRFCSKNGAFSLLKTRNGILFVYNEIIRRKVRLSPPP